MCEPVNVRFSPVRAEKISFVFSSDVVKELCGIWKIKFAKLLYFKISNTGMSRSPIVPQIEAHQWELFLSEVNSRKTIAAIEANNDTL